MRLTLSTTVILLGISSVTPISVEGRVHDMSRREAEVGTRVTALSLNERTDENAINSLEKRRGGGSPGGRGSSGDSGGSGSSGGRSGSSGSGNTGTASSSSSIGPSYGGGRYYGGGSTSAYRAGGRSPLGLAPYALAGAGLAIFPGLWLYGAYAYNFQHPYYFHNASNTTDSKNNESLPVTCLCDQYSACGCDDDGNTSYIDSLLGDGTASSQNDSLVHIGNVNGSKTVVINGTLPNGTDDSTSTTTNGASGQKVLETSGLWLVVAIVAATVFN